MISDLGPTVSDNLVAPFHAARVLLAAGEAMVLPQLLPNNQWLLVAYCRSGSGILSGEIEADLLPGHLMLLAGPSKTVLHASDGVDVTFIGFPASIVRSRLGRAEPMNGATAPMPGGFALMFDGLALAISRRAQDPGPHYDAILRAATDFAIALVENVVPAGLGLTTHAQLLLARAKRIVDARLHEPTFRTSVLASALGIRARYLRALFAGEGGRASDYIADRRLRHGRRLLVDQAQRHRAISDIARASGFVSQSHFARVIRQRFGASPTALRAAHVSPHG